MAIALHHSRASGTAKLILIGIANHDGDGGAWPSVATLARYAGGVNRRNVQRGLERLEQLGEIRRGFRAGGTAETPEHLRPNLYYFMLKCPPHCDHTSQHRDSRKALVHFDAHPAAVAPRGGDSAAPPAAVAPPEPSLNRTTQVKEKNVSQRAGASNRDGLPADSHSDASESVADAYSRLIDAKCPGRRTGPHVWLASGYCEWCGDRQPSFFEPSADLATTGALA